MLKAGFRLEEVLKVPIQLSRKYIGPTNIALEFINAEMKSRHRFLKCMFIIYLYVLYILFFYFFVKVSFKYRDNTW